jgi:hypothetical protein
MPIELEQFADRDGARGGWTRDGELGLGSLEGGRPVLDQAASYLCGILASRRKGGGVCTPVANRTTETCFGLSRILADQVEELTW